MAEPSVLLGPAVTHVALVDTRPNSIWNPNPATVPEIVLAMDRLQPFYGRLAALSALPANWDSYGASPIGGKAISGAQRLVSKLSREFPDAEGTAPYTLAPLANGGVQIEWRGPHGALELEVDPKGRISGLLVEDHETGRSYEERSRLSMTDATLLVSRTLGL